MVFQYSDYRDFLKTSLAERISKNPHYSLRSFAKGLGISPAMLSLVHHKKRNLNQSNAMRIAKRLGLTGNEAEYFCYLVQYEAAKSPEAKELALERINNLNPSREITSLSLDAFKVISQWYHFPILQLLRLDNFEFQSKNIAKALGITAVEAESALERLVRLGILEEKDGAYKRLKNDLRVQSEEKNEALRAFHKQMLIKAIESLETQSTKEKYVGSQTIAIDLQQLPQARKHIDGFFEQMNAIFRKSAEPTEVYHLGVQLFRITRPK